MKRISIQSFRREVYIPDNYHGAIEKCIDGRLFYLFILVN